MWKRFRPIAADWTARIIFSFITGTVIEVPIAGLTLRQSLLGRCVMMPLILGLSTPYRWWRRYCLKRFKVLDAKGFRQKLKQFAVETAAYSIFYLGIYGTRLWLFGATGHQVLIACATLSLTIAPLGIPFGIWADFVTYKLFRIPRVAEGAADCQPVPATPSQGDDIRKE